MLSPIVMSSKKTFPRRFPKVNSYFQLELFFGMEVIILFWGFGAPKRHAKIETSHFQGLGHLAGNTL